jgi:S1-C subfamily serine protease
VVTDVASDSEAASAGLRPGDVILEINRQPVQTVEQFTRLYKTDAKQTLLLVYRGGGTIYLLLQK